MTRQLQYVLDVEGVDYRRLEVSSPGIDRPLRNDKDFARFEGQVIDITLRQPIGADGAGIVSGQRKKFRGLLASTDAADEWQKITRRTGEAARMQFHTWLAPHCTVFFEGEGVNPYFAMLGAEVERATERVTSVSSLLMLGKRVWR